MAAKQKLTLYFPEEIVAETKQEALRQDRSLSWIIQMAWMMARERMQDLPGIEDFHLDIEETAH